MDSTHQDAEKAHVEAVDAAAHDGNGAVLAAGVRRIEAVWKTSTRAEFWFIYIGILAVAYVYSINLQFHYTLEAFITSFFKSHSSGIATMGIISGTLNAVTRVPVAKIADVFGRWQAMAFCVVCYALGYILMCVAKSFGAYAGASVLWTIGTSGVYMMQQIMIADTTSLRTRGFFSSLPDYAFVINAWVGPIVAEHFQGEGALDPNTGEIINDSWRWGYGMIVILIVIVSQPVILGLAWIERRAMKRITTKIPGNNYASKGFWVAVHHHMDLLGVLLLIAGLFVFLFPFAKANTWGWEDARIISMIVIGFAILVAFFVQQKFMSRNPIFPPRFLTQRTIAGCFISGFLLFVAFGVYAAYYTSYLVVTRGYSFKEATWVWNGSNIAGTICSIAVGALMVWTKRFKTFAFIGAAVLVIGYGLLINLKGPENSNFEVIATQVLAGVGTGILTTAVQVGAQAAVPHKDVAMLTAVFLTICGIGSTVGGAIAGGIWTNLMTSKINEYLPGVPAANVSQIVENIVFAGALPEPFLTGVKLAYVDVAKIINIVALCFLIPIFIALWFVEDLELTDELSLVANNEDVKEAAEHRNNSTTTL
ncbi:hypothetical protein PhCBS80983_g02350 [Powellomyces hirtus]|uniref:Major facilitator superfamily (MFS) profile domain-containing protein n=1 Tax=Powellomyces hirtus TaxID=109895 RepID=A0A507E6U4_9FUNG|nr:hypothetical protein PhCBS80983_g02350 [Powellomyces hirtus]